MEYKFLDDLWTMVDGNMPLELRRQNPKTSEDIREIVSVGCRAAYEGLDEDDYGYQTMIAPYEAVIRRCEVDHPDWLENVLHIISRAWSDLAEQARPEERDSLLFKLKSFAWEAQFHRANTRPQ